MSRDRSQLEQLSDLLRRRRGNTRLAGERRDPLVPPHAVHPSPIAGSVEVMLDQLDRPLRDLRVSVTDRCNLRCPYCMPREVYGPGFSFMARDELLTFEEIARVCRVLARLGVSKIRLTGGEPLLRRELEQLVAMLATMDGID